jgi:hypothetical protein
VALSLQNVSGHADRRHVANYAQWRSQKGLDALTNIPSARIHMREAADIATMRDN